MARELNIRVALAVALGLVVAVQAEVVVDIQVVVVVTHQTEKLAMKEQDGILVVAVVHTVLQAISIRQLLLILVMVLL